MVKLGAGLFLVAFVIAAIVLVPRITETKRERAEQERKHAAAAMAERRRRLIAEQRPHSARAAAGASRPAVEARLEALILADARARVAAGDLRGPAAKRVECEPVAHGQDVEGKRVAYDCIAVTSDLPSIDDSPGGVIGHPFRAVAELPIGRLTWCKVSVRPPDANLAERALFRLPRACSR